MIAKLLLPIAFVLASVAPSQSLTPDPGKTWKHGTLCKLTLAGATNFPVEVRITFYDALGNTVGGNPRWTMRRNGNRFINCPVGSVSATATAVDSTGATIGSFTVKCTP